MNTDMMEAGIPVKRTEGVSTGFTGFTGLKMNVL
jgi:hypothetical protein